MEIIADITPPHPANSDVRLRNQIGHYVMKPYFAFAVICVRIITAASAQNEDARRSQELSRESANASAIVMKFEKALSRDDLVSIKGLLIGKISDEFEVDQIAREVGMFANGDIGSSPGRIVGAVQFRGSKGKPMQAAVIRTESDSKVEKRVRSYFLQKEGPNWRVILVSPSALDGFFLLTLRNNPDGPIFQSPQIRAEQSGADQPATKPADKVPAKIQPSTPTPKDSPR